jgi:hypothetical protein
MFQVKEHKYARFDEENGEKRKEITLQIREVCFSDQVLFIAF